MQQGATSAHCNREMPLRLGQTRTTQQRPERFDLVEQFEHQCYTSGAELEVAGESHGGASTLQRGAAEVLAQRVVAVRRQHAFMGLISSSVAVRPTPSCA